MIKLDVIRTDGGPLTVFRSSEDTQPYIRVSIDQESGKEFFIYWDSLSKTFRVNAYYSYSHDSPESVSIEPKRSVDLVQTIDEILEELKAGSTERAEAFLHLVKSNGDVLTDLEQQLQSEE